MAQVKLSVGELNERLTVHLLAMIPEDLEVRARDYFNTKCSRVDEIDEERRACRDEVEKLIEQICSCSRHAERRKLVAQAAPKVQLYFMERVWALQAVMEQHDPDDVMVVSGDLTTFLRYGLIDLWEILSGSHNPAAVSLSRARF
ncbi:MAG: hypothetical protein H0Z39_03985 [Peptococcaceae bacterium]|nr:hypothetical protein [Peptococcaceae bacterium]